MIGYQAIQAKICTIKALLFSKALQFEISASLKTPTNCVCPVNVWLNYFGCSIEMKCFNLDRLKSFVLLLQILVLAIF